MRKASRLRTLPVTICAVVAILLAPPVAVVGASTNAAPAQPYLAAIDRTTEFPALAPVRVAVIDTGIDGDHPDFAGRIVAARRFAPGNPLYPGTPHGTEVAGLIGAIDGNGEGIDGIAPNARLLVGAVMGGASQSYDTDSVARAIRWAADDHARVINLSLAGLGPVPGYQQAVDYALAHGALVVAAAGNCFDRKFARCTPPGSEQAPAWLPHVLTVGATNGHSPAGFSIPSARWVDLAAPGQLVTTLWPTRNNPYFATPDCAFLGTTSCYSTGGSQDRPWGATGTSFATAMVSGAAAILFGADPRLQPQQVAALLEETARPIFDPRHQAGAGQLDIGAALQRVETGALPRADYAEPNDRPDEAARLPSGVVQATLDWHDDPADFYRLTLHRGSRLVVSTRGTARGTASVISSSCRAPVASATIGGTLRYIARCSGPYLLRFVPRPGTRGAYSVFTKTR